MSGRASMAVIVVALALLAGCDSGRSLDDVAPVGQGGQGGQPAGQPYEIVQGSFDKLVAAGTARIREDSFTKVASQQYNVTGTGVSDLRARSYDLGIDIPMLGSLRAIGLGNVVYAKSATISQLLPTHPNWLQIDPARLPADSPIGNFATDPFIRFALSAGDALPQLALVKGARQQDTRVVGPDTIDGDPVTHYQSTLEVAQARRYTTDPSIVAAIDRYTQTVSAATLPADVWVDAQGRLRRLSLVFQTDFSKPGTASTLTFSALGAPIPPIVAPPANEVTDALSLLPRAGG